MSFLSHDALSGKVGKLIVQARIITVDGPREFSVTGQNARTLLALVNKGPRGATALEVSNWAFRLAAYVHELKHLYGLNIVTLREAHPGGCHGRYVLLDAVVIVSVKCPRGAR